MQIKRWPLLVNRSQHYLPVVVLLGMICTGIAVHGHYGISTDEQSQAEMLSWHWQVIRAHRPWQDIPGDLEYYGVFFNAISVIPYFLGQMLHHPGHSIEQILAAGIEDGSLFAAKHLSTFLFSLMAYGAVALFTKDLVGQSFAAGGMLLLALIPRFWGHSFFNPKDIPFAALFTVVSYVGACFAATLLNAHPASQSRRHRFGLAALFGLVAGLLTCIRVGGFVVLLFGLLVQVILQVVNRPQTLGADVRRLLLPYGLVFLCWAGVTTLLSPIAWRAPIHWFVEAIVYLSRHDWTGVTLTFGQNWPRQPPWYYLPVWLGITTPLLTLALAFGGWVAFLVRWSRGQLNGQQQAIVLWLTLQFGTLPLVAMVRQSTIYNGLRQFLFLLPVVAVFAIAALALLLRALPHRRWQLGVLSTCLVIYSAVGWDMIRLHPYEYIYFNALARPPQLERNFETDYWALSAREAIEWINRQPQPNKTVYYIAPHQSVLPFADPDMVLVDYFAEKPSLREPQSFYYLTYPRNKHGQLPHPLDFLPQCDRVFTVRRPLGHRNVSLAIVKWCPAHAQ